MGGNREFQGNKEEGGFLCSLYFICFFLKKTEDTLINPFYIHSILGNPIFFLKKKVENEFRTSSDKFLKNTFHFVLFQ